MLKIGGSQPCRQMCLRRRSIGLLRGNRISLRLLHASASLAVVKPFLLADIGEGIKEIQIIQWFVQPGARVEQFDKLCEVQSDKAATEITSRFDGVIKKLHYEAEDMAQVGKPLCDIDIKGEIAPEDEALTALPGEQAGSPDDAQQPQKAVEKHVQDQEGSSSKDQSPATATSSKHIRLATPAVRGLLKELNVNISHVTGTGKDGRVLKEDVHKYAAARDSDQPLHPSSSAQSPSSETSAQRETPIPLTPIQTQMFKTMTRSLSIPHFLYADEINLSPLSSLRARINAHPSTIQKLSYLPFIIKAVSIALAEFPILNARIETPPSNPNGQSPTTKDPPPRIILREKINIGIAMDTPQGLLVPVLKNTSSLSIHTIASLLSSLQTLAQAGNLSAADLTGGTFTISNIGSIGGTYVSPLCVSNEVGILGIGRAREVPAFGEAGDVVRRLVGNFSWSADHRVLDGATVARVGERVRGLVEEPGIMLAGLR